MSFLAKSVKNPFAQSYSITKFSSRKFFNSAIQKKTHGGSFPFLLNPARESKPRKTGQTEIRGPYYSPMGKRYLSDILETMGSYVDSLKFAGGSFTLYPENELRGIIELAHEYDVKVSTGGFIERVLLAQGIGDQKGLIDKYMKKCKDFGFDTLEISAGFISIPSSDFLRLINKASTLGLIPKPELGIQFGSGGGVLDPSLTTATTKQDIQHLISRAHLFLKETSTPLLMIESEGITENVPREQWRTDVIARIIQEVGKENVMFEAADPEVFTWFVKNYGADVNLFVDHSQIVQLECLR
ncbi:2105_t:CDS:2 [Funneliformis geosporum]|uniref:2105_t:CDS:1 n=1 Tax=Funneliformis geosporum TaxID=1117311 RepID=A0A9W4WQ50_9GLOM|nr:2105_t:CDS:2 [Funneliformis geosporum]